MAVASSIAFAAATAAICSLSLLTVGSYGAVDFTNMQSPPMFIHKRNPEVVYFMVENEAISRNETSKSALKAPILRCKAAGNPPPEYFWYRNDTLLDIKSFNGSIKKIPNEGSIRFHKIKTTDAGSYVCKAKNKLGIAISETVLLKHTFISLFAESSKVVYKEVNAGGNFHLKCDPPISSPPAEISWILQGDGNKFETIKDKSISTNDEGSIFFHYIMPNMSLQNMYYTCNAANQVMSDYKFGNKFGLNITGSFINGTVTPTEFYTSSENNIALFGNQQRLYCLFSGSPIPEPSWYHNGLLIPYNNGKSGQYTFENYGKSILFNVTWESGGIYECRFNQHSGLDRTFNVSVKAKPYWIDGPPHPVNTSEGEEAVIRCAAGGVPSPKIEFLKNGVLIDENASHIKVEGDTLTIKNVKKSKNIDDGDDAVYQCRVVNEYGLLWENIPLRIFALPPTLQSDSGTVSVVKKKTAILKCKFAASPKVSFIWKGPSSDKIIEEGSRQDTPNEGILEIKDVDENDAGSYICIAKNKYGTASSTVSLIVREPTLIVPFSETLKSVVAGKDIYIPCNATHDENLQVVYEWHMNNNLLREDLLKSGHYLIDGNHGLHIKNPTRNDAARYECIARTELDEANSSISIDVKDVPKAVHQVSLTCLSDKNVAKVMFTYFEDTSVSAAVNEFWVQYRIGNGTFDEAAWQTYPHAIFVNKIFEIENGQRKFRGVASLELKPFGNYQFRVFGRNNIGDGVPVMADDTCETAPSIPTRNPSHVVVKIINRDQIKVSWDPLPREDWNGQDFHYVVKQRKKGADEWNETVVDDPFQNFVILNINDGADGAHEIQVGVRNSEGSPQVSPQSVDIVPSEGDLMHLVPSNFRVAELGSTSVKFEWDPVTSIASNNSLIKIKITCKPLRDDDELNSETASSTDVHHRNKREVYQDFRRKRNAICGEEYDESPRTVIVSLNETKYKVEGFCPDTKYKAQIALSNGETDEDASEITFTTLKGVPSQVQDLEASAVNNIEKRERGVVVVSWNHPKRSKESDMEYIVEVCKIQQNNAIVRDSCPTIETKDLALRLTDLDFDTRYRVIVTGVTSIGKGDPNSCDVQTVSEVVNNEMFPVKPSVSAEASENSIEYKVTPGATDEDRPVGNVFYVEYREEGSDEWKKSDNLVSDLRSHLSGLEAGTNYDLHSVAAYVDERGSEVKTVSPDMKVRTAGAARASAKLWLLLLIVLIILLVFCILCVICIAARRRGAKYPVSEKERQQGRIPILPDDKERGFGEYMKPEDDEKRSLTGGSKAESETDSMAEYGDSDPGRFTEDGSFIGQYVPNKTLVSTSATGRPDRESASTFV